MGTGFRDFVRAFGVRWFVVMSGPLSVPLALATYFVQNDAAKFGLFVTALCGAVFASYWVWKVEREARIKAETESNIRINQKTIREPLAAFMSDGKALMRQCFKDDMPPPTDETNKWGGRVEGFLIETLDKSYAERMHTAPGIELTLVSPNSVGHFQGWQALYIRIWRLQEFVKELCHD